MNRSYAYSERGGGSVRYYTEQLTHGFHWKAVLSVLLTIVITIENIYGSMLWGFLAFFTMDFITGILKSIKNNVPITSRRLRDSAIKLSGYMILLTCVVIASHYRDEFTPMVTWVYYYFMITEGKSILENIQEMGVQVPKFLTEKLDEHLDRIDPYIPKIIKKLIKRNKEE